MKQLKVDETKPLMNQIHELTHSCYPEFITHDQTSRQYWDSLYEDFPEYQIVLVENDSIAAVANSIPVQLTEEIPLKTNGWDWALETGVLQKGKNTVPNTLIGLSVAVHPSFRGSGLSSQCLDRFKELAGESHLARLLIPVRPTKKQDYPLMSFSFYVDLKNGEKSFDPWLKLHLESGGRPLGICERSMTISGTVSEWEAWTKMPFPVSGEYHIPGGLAPLTIVLEKDLGTYLEPNVWVEHSIKNGI
jgi:GNAT superfamily N-acetyltransferase